MRISRLQLKNVRRHADLDLQLAPGLTVVRGPNESGKSTIQRAIELALTRRVTSGSADLDGMRSWNASDDDRPWVRIEFEQEDLDGVRSGTLEKSFRGSRGTVKLELDGETITDPARADEVLADLTGIPSEGFFRSTASVRHHELDGLQRDEAALRDRLQASISGADRGTSRARRTLEKALYDLNTKGDKNPGKIKAAEAELATATAAQRNGEAALVQLERDRDSLAQAREDRAVAEAALAEQRSLLEKARLAERLIAERDQARERFQRYSTAVDVSQQIDHLEQTHPSPNGLPALREAMSKVRAADLRIHEIKAALAGEIEVSFVVEEPTPRAWRPTAIAAIVVILLAVAIVVGNALNLLPRELGFLRDLGARRDRPAGGRRARGAARHLRGRARDRRPAAAHPGHARDQDQGPPSAGDRAAAARQVDAGAGAPDGGGHAPQPARRAGAAEISPPWRRSWRPRRPT